MSDNMQKIAKIIAPEIKQNAQLTHEGFLIVCDLIMNLGKWAQSIGETERANDLVDLANLTAKLGTSFLNIKDNFIDQRLL